MSVDIEQIVNDIQRMPLGDRSGDEYYQLMDFQRDFLAGAFADHVAIANLTIGRGGGKTALISAIALLYLLEGFCFHRKNAMVHIFATSFDQARICGQGCLGTIRHLGLEGGFWIADNPNNFVLKCKRTGAQLKAHGSDPRRAHGLRPDLLVLDEPSQAQTDSGVKLFSALSTSLGKKRGARLIQIGTRPSSPLHFFQVSLDDVSNDVFSMSFAADQDDDEFSEETWKLANPGLDRNMPAIETLRAEALRAQVDEQSRATFRSLRCNMGVSDLNVSNELLSISDFKLIEGVPQIGGPFVMGIDLGGSSSFSAIAGIDEKTGGVFCLQAFGGAHDLAKLEQQESYPAGHYQRMVADGSLLRLGEKVVPIPDLLRAVEKQHGRPVMIAADRYRKAELQDAMSKAGWKNIPVDFRGQGFRDGALDVRLFRKTCLDQQITVPVSWSLRAAMAGSRTVSDAAGNEKLAKQSEAGRRRYHKDDICSSLIVATALYARRRAMREKPRSKSQVHILGAALPPGVEKKRSGRGSCLTVIQRNANGSVPGNGRQSGNTFLSAIAGRVRAAEYRATSRNYK